MYKGSPSGCSRREIPGETQVDEKGHEGNTELVTADGMFYKKKEKRQL